MGQDSWEQMWSLTTYYFILTRFLEVITKAKNKHHLLDTTGGEAREPREFLRTHASQAGKIYRELAS